MTSKAAQRRRTSNDSAAVTSESTSTAEHAPSPTSSPVIQRVRPRLSEDRVLPIAGVPNRAHLRRLVAEGKFPEPDGSFGSGRVWWYQDTVKGLDDTRRRISDRLGGRLAS